MSAPDRYTLKTTSRPENLASIAEFISSAAADCGLTEQEAYYAQMAVDEAVTNVIEHAYRGGEGPIEIIVERRSDTFVVTIRNQGDPFDPTSVPEPNVDAPLDEREPGGLGLFFMRRLMDNVTFRFNPDGWNEVIMTRRRRVIASAASRYAADVLVVAPRGRLDASGSQYLDGELASLADGGQWKVVVDFSQVTYISSTGLRVLLAAVKRSRRHAGDVKLCRLTPPVLKIFRMAGFDNIFSFYETERQAVEAFKA
ncbi:MAG: anti-sigma factor antagonist [Anaerolineae bacterium]